MILIEMMMMIKDDQMVEVDGRAIYPGFQFPQQPVVMMPGHQVILFTMTKTMTMTMTMTMKMKMTMTMIVTRCTTLL